MSDNEITKALECCCNAGSCVDCPLNRVDIGVICIKQNMINALDLITRQKAEIERLNETLDNIIQFLPACTDCEGKTPYGERTEKCVFEIDPSYCGKKAYELFVKMRTELETAKAEAIKEFAERLKKELRLLFANDEFLCRAEYNVIDNLVKEMVGEG